jgi:hypothetical protein
MNGLSAGLRQATKRSSAPCVPARRKLANAPTGSEKKHHAEARHDRGEGRGLERVTPRIGTEERRRRALGLGAGPRGRDHRRRDVDAEALGAPSDRHRRAARATADIEHAPAGDGCHEKLFEGPQCLVEEMLRVHPRLAGGPVPQECLIVDCGRVHLHASWNFKSTRGQA